MPRQIALTPVAKARPVRGLSRAEAAAYVGVSTTAFDQMILANEMPPPRLWRSKKIWDVRELDEAFEDLPYADGRKPKATGWEDVIDGKAKAALRS